MCLKIDNNKKRPVAKIVYRWKFLERTNDDTNQLKSPSMRHYRWKPVGKENVAECYNKDDDQAGFHVYTNKANAFGGRKDWANEGYYERKELVVVKLRVRAFKRAGVIENCDNFSDGKLGEIWKYATIVAVYNKDGKNITEQFA